MKNYIKQFNSITPMFNHALCQQANRIDMDSARLLDYKHKSFWLVVSGQNWLGAVNTASLNLQNVAVMPYYDVRREIHDTHDVIPFYVRIQLYVSNFVNFEFTLLDAIQILVLNV